MKGVKLPFPLLGAKGSARSCGRPSGMGQKGNFDETPRSPAGWIDQPGSSC